MCPQVRPSQAPWLLRFQCGTAQNCQDDLVRLMTAFRTWDRNWQCTKQNTCRSRTHDVSGTHGTLHSAPLDFVYTLSTLLLRTCAIEGTSFSNNPDPWKLCWRSHWIIPIHCFQRKENWWLVNVNASYAMRTVLLILIISFMTCITFRQRNHRILCV